MTNFRTRTGALPRECTLCQLNRTGTFTDLNTRNKRWVGIAGSIVLTVYAGYEALFFAWLTATPLTADQLKRAQQHCYAWFAIGVLSAASTAILSVLALRAGSRSAR